MRTLSYGLLSTAILAACLAIIPGAAIVGLYILEISPNPRHPPGDVMGEAVGWAVAGALFGCVSVMIGEIVVIRDLGGILREHKGLIIGGTAGVVGATILGAFLAVIQMDSTDGQAITSVSLGIFSGSTVGFFGGLSGVVIGVVLKRIVVALAP